MALPNPPLDLTGHCTSFHNNTLYVYSPAGFQSISLQKDAQWEVLPSGTSVQGGLCVDGNVPANDAASALYIVGGSANSSHPDYPGLQRYTYSTNQWESIGPVVPVTKDRLNHGATYLNESASILVYAGSQEPGNMLPSSQTFLISTAPPYNVLSFTSLPAPPLFAPMIMPWNNSHAVMMGGSSNNKNIFTFGREGWVDLGTSLPDAISDPKTTQCSIVTGDDGSKVVEEYNMGVSPNMVKRYALWTNGKPAPPGTVVGAPASSKMRRRDLTTGNWPPYNSSLAPTTTRSDYAIAQAPNGMAVISGGSATDPLVIFNQKQNSWVDLKSIFGTDSQVPLGTPSSTHTSSTLPTSSTSAAPAVAAGKTSALTVLGATLGAILGFAAILIIILLLLRWHADKTIAENNRRKAENEKANRLSFADQGTEYMHEAGGSVGRRYSASLSGSVTSLQIFNGRATGHRRGSPSDSSTLALMKSKSPLGITDPMEMQDKSPPGTATTGHRPTSPYETVGAGAGMTADRSEHTRSTGWSQYFADNNVTDLAAMPHHSQSYGHRNQSLRSSDMSRSDYDGEHLMGHPNNVRPLELNLGPRYDQTRPGNNAGHTALGDRGVSASDYGDAPPPIRNYFSDNRDSLASNMTTMTQFPRGVPSPTTGTFGNAFSKPTISHGPPPRSQPQSNDFPMPKAYFGSAQQRGSNASNMTQFPGAGTGSSPTLPPYQHARPVEVQHPPPAANVERKGSRGPTIRKMTGDEDMSWLNINAPPGGR